MGPVLTITEFANRTNSIALFEQSSTLNLARGIVVVDSYGVKPGLGCEPYARTGTEPGTNVLCTGAINGFNVQAGGANDSVNFDPYWISHSDYSSPLAATVDGGTGDDNLSGDWMIDGDVRGGLGVDQIRYWSRGDFLYGEDGDDSLLFNSGVSFGGAGNDLLDGGSTYSGATLDGGDGEDTLRDGGTLRGGNGADDLYGGEGDDYLWGGADHDHLEGQGDLDHLYGEGGPDTLFGGEDTWGNYPVWPPDYRVDVSSCGADIDTWYTQSGEPVPDVQDGTCENYGGDWPP